MGDSRKACPIWLTRMVCAPPSCCCGGCCGCIGCACGAWPACAEAISGSADAVAGIAAEPSAATGGCGWDWDCDCGGCRECSECREYAAVACAGAAAGAGMGLANSGRNGDADAEAETGTRRRAAVGTTDCAGCTGCTDGTGSGSGPAACSCCAKGDVDGDQRADGDEGSRAMEDADGEKKGGREDDGSITRLAMVNAEPATAEPGSNGRGGARQWATAASSGSSSEQPQRRSASGTARACGAARGEHEAVEKETCTSARGGDATSQCMRSARDEGDGVWGVGMLL